MIGTKYLTLYYLEGCEVCAAAKTALRKFRRKYPEITVREVDLTATEWDQPTEIPDSVPAYVYWHQFPLEELTDDNVRQIAAAGRFKTLSTSRALSLPELEKWVYGPLARWSSDDAQ
jgi:hypothetical protein